MPAYGFGASFKAAARRAWRAAEVVACSATPRRAALVRNALSRRLLQRSAPVAAKNIKRMLRTDSLAVAVRLDALLQ